MIHSCYRVFVPIYAFFGHIWQDFVVFLEGICFEFNNRWWPSSGLNDDDPEKMQMDQNRLWQNLRKKKRREDELSWEKKELCFLDTPSLPFLMFHEPCFLPTLTLVSWLLVKPNLTVHTNIPGPGHDMSQILKRRDITREIRVSTGKRNEEEREERKMKVSLNLTLFYRKRLLQRRRLVSWSPFASCHEINVTQCSHLLIKNCSFKL